MCNIVVSTETPQIIIVNNNNKNDKNNNNNILGCQTVHGFVCKDGLVVFLSFYYW